MVQIIDYGIGVCCFCGNDCSAFSQNCGSCARSLLGEIMGLDTPVNVDKVKIYYTGIGSVPIELYISEERFRAIMDLEKDNFNETCPLDPNTCDLLELMEWAGAEMYVPQSE